jgi:hypothetical protein
MEQLAHTVKMRSSSASSAPTPIAYRREDFTRVADARPVGCTAKQKQLRFGVPRIEVNRTLFRHPGKLSSSPSHLGYQWQQQIEAVARLPRSKQQLVARMIKTVLAEASTR